MAGFQLESRFTPQGDQPEAIRQLVEGIERGDKEQVLLGVTGSGKTFTIAKVIEAVNRPTLVLSHNKTLAAQLFQEFRSFFPHNAVEYFVSYYDYYQPEAYVPSTDTYIEKETSINEEIERLRLRATKALFERRDVIIVASVSCIYGLGSPEAFYGMLHFFSRGDAEGMDPVLKRLVDMQYQRTQLDLFHGSFRVRGDVLEILPAYEDVGIRVEYFGDEIERISRFDVLRGETLHQVERIAVYPKTHYVTPRTRLERAIEGIKVELAERLAELEDRGQAPRAAAPGAAHPLRPRDAQGDRLLPRHRELLAAPLRPRSGRAAADPLRLLPGRPADRDRREPPDHPAGARHVPRRPLAQADPGRLRLPPALGARQPAAHLRRVRRPGGAADLRLGHAGAVGAASAPAASSSSSSSAPPACSTPSSRSVPPRGRWTICWRRSARSWPARSGCW